MQRKLKILEVSQNFPIPVMNPACEPANSGTQIAPFCGVKFLAWKSGCVNFLTNSMSGSILSKTNNVYRFFTSNQTKATGLTFYSSLTLLALWHTFCPICKLALIALIFPKRLCLAINQEKWTHSSSVYVADSIEQEWSNWMNRNDNFG